MAETTRRAVMAMISGGLCLPAGLTACSSAASTTAASCNARANLYQCDGCEALAERTPQQMAPVVQLASATEPGERLQLNGTVFQHDGRTPASGVIIYAHQTNMEGLYANGSSESIWSRRHGRLRGWARTGADGRYRFDTIKPAPYPDETMPAHIHLFIGEPGRRPYYIDDVVFAGEFGVTADYVRRQELRGGSGIVSLVRTSDGTLLARRDITLECHPD